MPGVSRLLEQLCTVEAPHGLRVQSWIRRAQRRSLQGVHDDGVVLERTGESMPQQFQERRAGLRAEPVPVQPGLLRGHHPGELPHAVPVLQDGPFLSRGCGQPVQRMSGWQVLAAWERRRHGLQLPCFLHVAAEGVAGVAVRVRERLLQGVQPRGAARRLDVYAVQAGGVLL